MTRGEAMKLATAKGWKHIDAKTHACPKHAAKAEPKATKKVVAKPAKKADGKKIAQPVPAASTKIPPF